MDRKYLAFLHAHLPKLDYQSRSKIERVERKHASVLRYRGTYLHGGAAPFERKMLADAIRALRRRVVVLNGKRRAVAGWYRIRFNPDTDEAGRERVTRELMDHIWYLERNDTRE